MVKIGHFDLTLTDRPAYGHFDQNGPIWVILVIKFHLVGMWLFLTKMAPFGAILVIFGGQRPVGHISGQKWPLSDQSPAGRIPGQMPKIGTFWPFWARQTYRPRSGPKWPILGHFGQNRPREAYGSKYYLKAARPEGPRRCWAAADKRRPQNPRSVWSSILAPKGPELIISGQKCGICFANSAFLCLLPLYFSRSFGYGKIIGE